MYWPHLANKWELIQAILRLCAAIIPKQLVLLRELRKQTHKGTQESMYGESRAQKSAFGRAGNYQEGKPNDQQKCHLHKTSNLGTNKRMEESLTGESIGRPILTGPPPPPLVGRYA